MTRVPHLGGTIPLFLHLSRLFVGNKYVPLFEEITLSVLLFKKYHVSMTFQLALSLEIYLDINIYNDIFTTYVFLKYPERAQNTIYDTSKFKIFPEEHAPGPIRHLSSGIRMIKWFPEQIHLSVIKCPAFSSNKYGRLSQETY